MIATVIGVVTGLQGTSGAGKPYEYSDFTYKPDPYNGQEKKQVTRKVFSNLPVHDSLLQLTAGDRVELEFEKNGRFSNLTSVTKLADQSAPAPPQQPASSSGSKPTGKGKGGSSTFLTFDQRKELDAKKDHTICKQVALKAAVELTVATAKKGEQIDADKVNTLASDLLGFLTLKEDQFQGAAGEGQNQESTGQEHEPTGNPDDDIPF